MIKYSVLLLVAKGIREISNKDYSGDDEIDCSPISKVTEKVKKPLTPHGSIINGTDLKKYCSSYTQEKS